MADLIGHDRAPSAFVVYLHLYGRTAGIRKRNLQVSLQTIASDTGLSKSAVQSALRHLRRRRLIRTARASHTAVPEHFVLRPWIRRSGR